MKKKKEKSNVEFEKAPLPDEETMIGVITRLVGADRVYVEGSDGKVRLCRIPGRLRRKVWIREGDVVLFAPWPFQNGKGDILHRYTRSQVNYLKKLGYYEGKKK